MTQWIVKGIGLTILLIMVILAGFGYLDEDTYQVIADAVAALFGVKALFVVGGASAGVFIDRVIKSVRAKREKQRQWEALNKE